MRCGLPILFFLSCNFSVLFAFLLFLLRFMAFFLVCASECSEYTPRCPLFFRPDYIRYMLPPLLFLSRQTAARPRGL